MDVDNAASRGIVVDLEKGLVERPGYFFRADTVEGLAEAAGIDVGALAETVERYNASCDAGEDEEFGKPAECLLPVRTAPFYAVCETFVDWEVCGGVFTDLDRRVLDAGGEPIANLFAAGMCAARDTYANVDPGSCSIGTAVTAGYIAANRIADLLGK